MAGFYSAKRTRNLFDPKSKEPFRISRSKIDLFFECPRCFYLDRRLGIKRPDGPPFTLNSAVDKLLKKEFDFYRLRKKAHPLMDAYGLDLVPFEHEKMDIWRENFKGVDFFHKPTNFLVTGAIDDVWADKKGIIYIVDYKATSSAKEFDLNDEWKRGYKRQMEIYQWLFRRNGFDVSKTGYFVACNGKTDADALNGKLEFDVKIVSYDGDDSWVEETIFSARKCLDSEKLPIPTENCAYCGYRKGAVKVEKSF